MALQDQPYFPFYVDDWMNNNKLKMCSAGAHGLMVSIMCILHKSNDGYGRILLKQKFKQTPKQASNFACQFAKMCAFDLVEVEKHLDELVEIGAVEIDGEYLLQPRMVKDGQISLARAEAGSKGGKATQGKGKFAKAKTKAKGKQNTVNVDVTEGEDVTGSEREKRKEPKPELKMPWNDKPFRDMWEQWKDYRKVEHSFDYKSIQSEQAALTQLANTANGMQEKAIEIIKQSMGNGWKGFFDLKTNGHGKTANTPESRARYFAEKYSTDNAG